MTSSESPQTPTDTDLLWKMANALGLVAEPVPQVVPDRILAWCELFLDGCLDEKELESFYQIGRENPWVITLLRDFDRLNPGWRHAQEKWEYEHELRLRNRLLEMVPRVEQEFDFSILFEADVNAMDIAFNDRGTAVSQLDIATLEMAHGEGEHTSIKHTRSTDHFRLSITIGYSSASTFHMGIQVRSIDGRTDPQQCRIRIAKLRSVRSEDESTRFEAEAIPDTDSHVRFDDLTEGGYEIDFYHQGNFVENFTMQILRKG